MKLKSLLFAALMFVCNTHAGIINYDHMLADSFQDTDTGLIWMDFGVNNNQSYNFVASQLGAGGLYEGWRLPTIAEVYAMWASVADFDNVIADLEYPNYYGVGQLYGSDSNSFGGDDSVWESTFESIGFNELMDLTNSGYTRHHSYGRFMGTEGLSIVSFIDVAITCISPCSPSMRNDTIGLDDSYNYDYLLDDSNDRLSTLLVRSFTERDSTQVSAPATIALFALGVVGIGVTRRRLR